jgi:ABC-type Na+ transport system ATPase subunit NatA
VLGLLGPNGQEDHRCPVPATRLRPDRGRAMAGGLYVVRDARRVRRMIRALAGGGVTVLLTIQYVEEADALADHICVIDHGKFIADGTPADLKRVISEQAVAVRPADSRPECELACRSSLCRIGGNRAAVGNEYVVSKHGGGRAPPTWFRVAGRKGTGRSRRTPAAPA